MDLQNTMSDSEIDKFALEFFTIDTGGKFRYNLLTRSTEVNVEIPVCRKMFMAAFGMNPRVGGKPWAVLGKDRMKRLEDLKRKSVGELIIRSDKKVAKMGKHDARQHQHFNDEHNLNKLEGLKEFSRIGLKYTMSHYNRKREDRVLVLLPNDKKNSLWHSSNIHGLV